MSAAVATVISRVFLVLFFILISNKILFIYNNDIDSY
jgi:hypothetical protein